MYTDSLTTKEFFLWNDDEIKEIVKIRQIIGKSIVNKYVMSKYDSLVPNHRVHYILSLEEPSRDDFILMNVISYGKEALEQYNFNYIMICTDLLKHIHSRRLEEMNDDGVEEESIRNKTIYDKNENISVYYRRNQLSHIISNVLEAPIKLADLSVLIIFGLLDDSAYDYNIEMALLAEDVNVNIFKPSDLATCLSLVNNKVKYLRLALAMTYYLKKNIPRIFDDDNLTSFNKIYNVSSEAQLHGLLKDPFIEILSIL